MDASSKGQLPAKRKEKAQLLKTHGAFLKKQAQNPRAPRAVKQPGASEAYPPSTKAIADLEIIPLSALRIETHHHGQVIVVKTISDAYRGVAAVSVVEDEHGEVEKLALYNQSEASILSSLPEGCVVAVKEPYYKSNGGTEADFMICVDHPSDILLLRYNDPIIPLALRPDTLRTADDWKKAGDQAFLAKTLPTAVFCYTEGIALERDDSRMKADLLAKRAAINLVLAKFDAARDDALASVTGGPSDWKAYFTAGRAAYGLRDYQSSHDYHQQALKISPSTQNIKRELERCSSRMAEAKLGDFDFKQIFGSVSYRNVHLDHANFTTRVCVAESTLHGRGLFATEPIQAGDLIFCERAFIMPDQYEPSRASAALYATMVRQLYENPSLAEQVLNLHSGDYPRSGSEGAIVDGVPVTDVFLIEDIRRRNCFSAPLTTREEIRTVPTANGPPQTKGLWTYASYMNHSCVPNTARSFIGDMLICRAVRDIEAGEELFQNYTSIKAQVGRRQAEFRGWGFGCTCALCEGEASSTAERVERRTRLLGEIEKLAKKKQARGIVPDAAIRSMERMAKELEDAHEAEVYGSLPRLMLIYPTMWLLEAYKGRKNHAKVVASASRVLRNFGYEMGVDEGSRSVFGEGRKMASVLTIHVVTALRDAAEAYRSMANKSMAARCEEDAEFACVLVTGFEDDLSLLNNES